MNCCHCGKLISPGDPVLGNEDEVAHDTCHFRDRALRAEARAVELHKVLFDVRRLVWHRAEQHAINIRPKAWQMALERINAVLPASGPDDAFADTAAEETKS